MDERRSSLVLALGFAGLLAFHLWLLQRMVTRGDIPLSILLLVAISLFVWRIVHYARRYGLATASAAPVAAGVEIRRIQVYAPSLVALLALHAWLTTVAWAAGEVAFVVVLAGAVAVFAIRLGHYARRWRELRRRSASENR